MNQDGLQTEAPAAETRSNLRRYAVAILSFAISLFIRLTLSSVLGPTVPYITFFPGIMVSGWYGGLGPGLVTTVLSATAAIYFILGPAFSGIRSDILFGLGLFLAIGYVSSWLNEELHRARRRLESELAPRLESEGALSDSESRYRVIAETASDGIITIDEGSSILFANEAAARIFGYSVDELAGRLLTMLMPEYL